METTRYLPVRLKELRVPGPSLLDKIREAKTEEEIHANLLRILTYPASRATKRKWREAAERRLGQIRVKQLVLPPPPRMG